MDDRKGRDSWRQGDLRPVQKMKRDEKREGDKIEEKKMIERKGKR